MSADADIKAIREVAAAEAAAASAMLTLLGRELALGASGLLRCVLWTVLGVFAATSALVLLVATSVALALWLGLAWPWGLLLGSLTAALAAGACARLARRRLADADLSATRRQLRGWIASFGGERP